MTDPCTGLVLQSKNGDTTEYTLYVDDNYHYMDESERIKAGDFGSLSKPIAKAIRRASRAHRFVKAKWSSMLACTSFACAMYLG